MLNLRNVNHGNSHHGYLAHQAPSPGVNQGMRPKLESPSTVEFGSLMVDQNSSTPYTDATQVRVEK